MFVCLSCQMEVPGFPNSFGICPHVPRILVSTPFTFLSDSAGSSYDSCHCKLNSSAPAGQADANRFKAKEGKRKKRNELDLKLCCYNCNISANQMESNTALSPKQKETTKGSRPRDKFKCYRTIQQSSILNRHHQQQASSCLR